MFSGEKKFLVKNICQKETNFGRKKFLAEKISSGKKIQVKKITGQKNSSGEKNLAVGML